MIKLMNKLLRIYFKSRKLTKRSFRKKQWINFDNILIELNLMFFRFKYAFLNLYFKLLSI